jgi:hypothetical protein
VDLAAEDPDLGVMLGADLGVMPGVLRAVSGGELVSDAILAMREYELGENAESGDDDDVLLDDRGVPLLEDRRCSHSGEALGVHAEGASTSTIILCPSDVRTVSQPSGVLDPAMVTRTRLVPLGMRRLSRTWTCVPMWSWWTACVSSSGPA